MSKKEINFIDFVTTLVKWRKLIYINVVTVAIISLIISLLLPKWYKGEAIILPPETKGISFGVGAIGEIAGSFLGPSGYELPMLATRSDVFSTILESKRMAEILINENNLLEIYDKKNMYIARKMFNSHFKVVIGSDGSLFISFEAKEDPELAARVTNSAINQLDKINMELSQKKAKNTRIFLEKRLAEAKNNLMAAEDAFKSFQEKNKTIAIEYQTEATIKGASELVTNLLSLKIQKGVMSQTLDLSHVKMIELNYQINEIEKAIQEIVNGPVSESNKSDNYLSGDVYVPLGKVPDLSLQTVRLMRELKIQEMIFELITQQYEQFIIKEQEDTPTIQVLQYATPPQWKSRPKRAIIILVSIVFALFVSVVLTFFLEYINKTKNEGGETGKRFIWIENELKKDLRFFKKSK